MFREFANGFMEQFSSRSESETEDNIMLIIRISRGDILRPYDGNLYSSFRFNLKI